MAVINGTEGNDAFIAHTEADYLKGQLIFTMGAIPAAGAWPRPNIMINGQAVANVTVTSYIRDGNTQVVAVPLPNVPITSVGIHYFNDLNTQTEDRTLYIGSVMVNGIQLPVSQGSYAREGDTTIPGQNAMDWNGIMTWSGSLLSDAMAQPGAQSHQIGGGGGMDVVIYTGRERGNFDLKYYADAAITVGHWLSGFNDVLRNVENVLFDDRSAYGGGADAVVDANARVIDGGRGLDTLVLNGHRDQFHVTKAGVGFSIFGNGVDEWVTNVERLKFTNGYVALDIEGNSGQAYRLYQAAFDRVPDVPGLGYQTNALDTQLTLSQVAGNFIASPEFQSTYGNVSNSQFVTLLYQNVLDRAPDAGGLQYHVNRLESGVSRSDVLIGFSESPENQANVIGSIQNGMFFTMP